MTARAGTARTARGRPYGVLASLALVSLLAWGPQAEAARPLLQEIRVGERLPDGLLDGLNGPSRRLASWRGRPLLINVWASWCGPCRAEAASLEQLAWSPAGQAFAIIGISTDDERQAALDWLQVSHATLSHYLDHDLRMETLLGATHLPLTVLVDAEGRVLRKTTGSRDWMAPAARRWLRDGLRAAPAPG